jgi:DNA modification methylase
MVEDGWRLVRDVIWYKRDAVPESVKTRPTTTHEYLFMFTANKDHYYDWYAVREDSVNVELGWGKEKRLMRSVWDIPTEVYTEAHFATFPAKLPERCIIAGCPQRVCTICGEPQRRIVESKSIERMNLPRDHPQWRPRRYDDGKAGDPQSPGAGQRYSEAKHLGWTKCDCGGNFRRGTVLDPFLGSGTTALVARELNRNAIGYELNEKYCEIIRRRTSQLSLVSEQEVIL